MEIRAISEMTGDRTPGAGRRAWTVRGLPGTGGRFPAVPVEFHVNFEIE